MMRRRRSNNRQGVLVEQLAGSSRRHVVVPIYPGWDGMPAVCQPAAGGSLSYMEWREDEAGGNERK